MLGKGLGKVVHAYQTHQFTNTLMALFPKLKCVNSCSDCYIEAILLIVSLLS